MTKEERFKALLDDNKERIWRICRYYGANPNDQQDMYQEVLVNIWKSLDSFRGEAQVSTWIYRIAVNTSLTFSGKSVKQAKLFVRDETLLSRTLIPDEGIDHIEKEKQLDALKTAINQLSVIDQALITLMLEGLGMREIADVIGITEPNVKVKIHRIKEQLKQQLNAQNYGNE